MPLVRISHTGNKPDTFGPALSQGVHRAMVENFNVPNDDYFQIVTEHAAKTGLAGPDTFLDVKHTDNMVFVQITCAPGRSLEQKKALYTAIADNFVQAPGLRREDVFINLVETGKENWSFGNGLAQFA